MTATGPRPSRSSTRRRATATSRCGARPASRRPDVLAIAPTMDRVGFRACDFTSSTHMAVSVRFHREDPWERLRLIERGDAEHAARR